MLISDLNCLLHIEVYILQTTTNLVNACGIHYNKILKSFENVSTVDVMNVPCILRERYKEKKYSEVY